MDDVPSLVSVRGRVPPHAPERRVLWQRSPMACSRDEAIVQEFSKVTQSSPTFNMLFCYVILPLFL